MRTVTEKNSSSDVQTFINICKSFVGAGVLGLPFAIKNAGLYAGIFFTILLSYVNMYCVQNIIKCKDSINGAHTFADIGQAKFGRFGKHLVNVTILTCQLGFVCAYVEIIGSTMHEFFPRYTKNVYILMSFPLLVPLALLRNLKGVSIASALTLIVFAIGTMFIFYDGCKVAEKHSYDVIKLDTFGIFFGMVVFAFEGINVVIPIHDEMKSTKNFGKILKLSYFLMTTIFVVFASCCYMFYYDDVQDNISFSLDQGVIGNTVKLSFMLVVYLTFPMGIFPVIQIVEGYVFREPDRATVAMNENDRQYAVVGESSALLESSKYGSFNSSEHNNDSTLGVDRKGDNNYELKRNLVRSAVVVVIIIFTMVIPNLGSLMTLFGAFSNSLAAYILPAVFYLGIFDKKLGNGEKFANYSIVVLGTCAMIVSTYNAVILVLQGYHIKV